MIGKEPGREPGWMRIGALASAGLSLLLWILRRPRPARWALGFAVACGTALRDARLSRRVHELLARSGRDT